MLKVYAKKDVKVVALEVGTEKEPLTITATAEKFMEFVNGDWVDVDITVAHPDKTVAVSCAYYVNVKVDFTEDAILKFALDTLETHGEKFVAKYHSVIDRIA